MRNFSGLHSANYFGDFGRALQYSLVRMGLRIFRAVFGQAGVILGQKRRICDEKRPSGAYMGASPSPEKVML